MERADDLVSVIMPLYNASAHVAETIESVLTQSYVNWELVVVDDCSTDESPQIVESYVNQDERIHYFRNESNRGVAFTRNAAIAKARGRYIAFLDSDDTWCENKLSVQLQKMREENCAFCYSSCAVMDENGNNLHKDRIVPSYVNFKKLLKGNVIPCLTVVIDRQVVDAVAMPEIPHEDYATWLTILRDYEITACGVQEVLATYRVNTQSVSSNKGKAMKWTYNIYRKYLGLSLVKSCYYFCWYAVKAVLKRAVHVSRGVD